MFDIYSEVRAVLSAKVVSSIEGCVMDTVKQCVLTADVEQVTLGNETQYHLCGTLDGILIAKTKLEDLLNFLHIKQLEKESSERESTTLSEENSSFADEGNTSYDKEGTDKTSCLSDDKELETNASSNGNISTNTESSNKTMRLRSLSKKLRFILKERPRVSQRIRSTRLPPQLRTLKKKSILRNKSQRSAELERNDPEALSKNLEHMKLATEESDFDSPEAERKKNTKSANSLEAYKHFCDMCSFKTKRSSHFMKHKAVHEKVFKCPHCSYTTTKQRYYDRHQRLHCLKRNYLHQCEQCCYKTHRKEHFVRHVNNVHGDKRPYLCHVCGKAFKRGDALQQHNRTHSEVLSENANYKCSVCEKQFRSQSHLLEHRAVHSEFRSFLCEICGAVFKTRSVHRKHVQSIHRNPRAYPCDSCGKKFNTMYTLKRHKKTHSAKNQIPKSVAGTRNGTSDAVDLPLTSLCFPSPVTEMNNIPSTSAIQPMNPPALNPPLHDPVAVDAMPVSLPETAVSEAPHPAAVLFLTHTVP